MRLIDADKLSDFKIKKSCEFGKSKKYYKGWNSAINEIIENAPTVKKKQDLNQKVGRWVRIADCWNAGWFCSECNKKLLDDEYTRWWYQYCPYCGTKMRTKHDECGF